MLPYIDSETLSMIVILCFNGFLWQFETIIGDSLVISISETEQKLERHQKEEGVGSQLSALSDDL